MTEKTWVDSQARSRSRARKHKMTMWQNPAEYYCRVYRRQFDKLKALCGHMGAHGDRSWQGLLPPPDHHHHRPSPPTCKASTSTGMRGSDSRARSKSRAQKHKMTMWQNPAEYYCRVCRRQFDKLKALCGHMRAHGDRSWQGLLPPPDHHYHHRPSPPTYEASTSTGMRGGLGINFQREPQVKVFASLKFDLNMLPTTEPQEKVPVTLKLEMQAAPEPREKVLAPEADLDSHEKFNFDLNEAPEEDGANDY